MIPPERVIGRLAFEFVRPPSHRLRIESELLEASEKKIVLAHALSPSRPLRHLGEVVLDTGYWAVWFLFKGRPYDVGRVYRPDGSWMGYYVDVLKPVRWRGADPKTLEPLVDLFLDIWVAPDGTYSVLDEDEFEEAIRKGHLSRVQVIQARTTLRNLTAAIDRAEFPPAAVKAYRL
ncbi:MAG: DUF402 domain-containing protein [Armatimonadota bacterium]|nr:DUF402 domain-containing protein [Armatimonadota bacterium]MDR5697206.1 DUF402 domain-containing protein [Armatimonadota bacterium]